MADLLKFKRGVYKDLPENRVAGTIYVTTDEGAMYVDLATGTSSTAERIRIGETIQFADKAAFAEYLEATAPPYDTRAFYYIIGENALLKWVADGSGSYSQSGKWQQINSTSALSSALTALSGRVGTLETNLDSVTERVGTAESDIDDLEAAVATKAAQTDLNNLTNTVNDLSDAVNTKATQTDLTALTNRVTAVETKAGTLSDSLGSSADAANAAGSAYARIKQNAADIATKASASDLTALTNTVSDLTTTVGKKAEASDVTALTTRVGTAETDITTIKSNITSLQSEVDTKANNTEFQTVKTTVGDSSSGLVKQVADLESNSASKTELKTISDKVDKNSSDIATNAAAIKDIQDAIGDGSGTGSLSNRVTALEDKVGDETKGLVKDVDALESSIGTSSDPANASGSVYARIAKNKADIATNASNITTNTTDITTLKSDASSLKNRTTALETSVGASDDTADASGSVYARIAKNKADIATNAGNINANTNAIATNIADIATNTSNIAALSTDIANTNKAIGSASDDAGANTVYGAINKNKEDITNLNTTLLEKINAANSMTYKGGVESTSGLPTSGVKVGDTYVVTNFFTMADTTAAYTGDMIIASGTEGNDGYITSNTLTWTVVNTGYIQEHESKLTVADNTIALTSYTATAGSGDLGKIQLKSDNLEISTSADGTVTLNAVWGSFTD